MTINDIANYNKVLVIILRPNNLSDKVCQFFLSIEISIYKWEKKYGRKWKKQGREDVQNL